MKVKYNFMFVVISILLFASRLIQFGIIPGGVHVDEAYAGYEAWAMLSAGTDSWGYTNPVYLTVWGSGMSVMNAILMMPFISVFGLNEVTIRLPQVMIAIASVYVFYLLIKKIWGQKAAIIGFFLITICPWHMMMSRWGLDCNLAPGFLIFSTYFFVKGIEKNKYFILAGLFFGLSLYCYATIWIVLPILLLVWGIYCLCNKVIKEYRYVWIGIGVLGMLAIPLLLFVAVNIGLIEEITTEWISIPKLVVFRSDELGWTNLFENIKQLIRLFIVQEDGKIWNAIPYFGMYYLFSVPFMVAGGLISIARVVKSMKEGKICYEFFILSWVIIGCLCAVFQAVNVYQINYCHVPLIILWMIGVHECCEKFGHVAKKIVVVLYLLSFGLFMGYYLTEFQDKISKRQLSGTEEAISKALELFETGEYDAICLTEELRHPRVLFYTQWPVDEYIESVTWQNYPDRYLKAASFGPFCWEDIQESKEQYIYIIEQSEMEFFKAEGWNLEEYDYMIVAYKP